MIATQIRQKDGVFPFVSYPAQYLLAKIRFISRFYADDGRIEAEPAADDEVIVFGGKSEDFAAEMFVIRLARTLRGRAGGGEVAIPAHEAERDRAIRTRGGAWVRARSMGNWIARLPTDLSSCGKDRAGPRPRRTRRRGVMRRGFGAGRCTARRIRRSELRGHRSRYPRSEIA
jgi:hypothetical protein